MSRRLALWLLAALVLALGAVLLAIDPSTKADGNPTIVDFELAGGEERAAEILADWGQEGRDAARLSLWLDYPYLIAYGAFLALAAAATRDLARRRGWSRLAALGPAAITAAIAAASFDALENAGLLLTLGGHGGNAAPLLATIFASAKFALLAVAVLYLLAGLARRAGARLAGA